MRSPLIFICLVFITISPAGEKSAKLDFTSSNLPIVIINSHGQTIVNEPKITADMGIIFNGEGKRNNVTDSLNHYNGKIGIEIRGSSSQSFPKKQYGIETRDASGVDQSVSFFGMPEESDWILSAQYNDKSLIRDALTYFLSNSISRYASRSRYCELVLNGDYKGVYLLFEKVKRDKGRVNISKLDSTGQMNDALTGGYIFKIDKLDGADIQGWYSNYLPKPGSPYKILYQYHYPKQEDITAAQKNYIKNFVSLFEGVFNSSSYADPVTGYRKYLDVASMVDYFLINELGKNVDGYRLSTYMYKDKDSKNPKLFFGPLWDFNHAYGNSDYYEASTIPGWQLTFFYNNTSFQNTDMWQLPFWWSYVLQDTSFMNLARNRWIALRSSQLSLNKINAFIDSVALHINEAQQRNFVRWPILNVYVWPNAYIGGSYVNEIAYLKTWIFQRVTWIDWKLNGGPVTVKSLDEAGPASIQLGQNFPNPFNPTTTIEYSVAEHLPGLNTNNLPGLRDLGGLYVTIKVYDVLGNEIKTLVNEQKLPGNYSVHFNAASFPSGMYYYRLQLGAYSMAKKLLLIK